MKVGNSERTRQSLELKRLVVEVDPPLARVALAALVPQLVHHAARSTPEDEDGGVPVRGVNLVERACEIRAACSDGTSNSRKRSRRTNSGSNSGSSTSTSTSTSTSRSSGSNSGTGTRTGAKIGIHRVRRESVVVNAPGDSVDVLPGFDQGDF